MRNATELRMESLRKSRIAVKTEIFYPVILVALAALLVAVTAVPCSLYGSTTDWFSQHVSIAETMRRTMLEEGTLFPGQLPLGGGNNIYDFAYYGYLRPDVLLSCLLPGVAMRTIITVYSVAEYLCSVLLFYLLLKRKGMKEELALLGGTLFLCAGCFFQIHRHIMFVNYMPFLLGALLCVLQFHKTGKRALLLVMMTLIYLHSYYYSISCLLVIYLFLLYTAQWNGDGCIRQWWRMTWRYAKIVLVSVAMAGVLLLPTASSILSCASTKDPGNAGKNPWEISRNLESLLYSGYGLGLTLIALFLLLLTLCRKKARLLAAAILFTMVFGLVPLVLNGFLYNRAKILMPFLPLVLLLCMETLWEFWSERRRPPVLILLPLAGVTWLQYKERGVVWVWADLALVCVLFLILFLRWREAYTANGHKKRLFVGTLTVTCLVAYFFAVTLHRNDNYIEEEKTVISRFSDEERADFYQKEGYRFDTFLNPYNTGNSPLARGAGRTSMYTSTSNAAYSRFFYDEMRTPIGNNNRVGLMSRANPFLMYLMGVRYLEAKEGTVPVGYEVRRQNGNTVLAERKDVLPLCYGSVELLSGETYEQLDFPENLEAVTARSVVEGNGECSVETEFQSHFREIYPREGIDYQIEEISEREFTIVPTEPVKNKILAVSFGVKNNSRAAVTIAVNGITNKLSGASAPYPNHNDIFTYLLSSPEPITEFRVKTSGSYEIENLHIYSLDQTYLGNRSVIPFQEETKTGERSAAETTEPGQKMMASGTITMPTTGYLITSFPVQRGYRAWVDGEPVSVETVNSAFVGLPLTAGTHEIVLIYEPPLQRAGMVLSAAGWLLWAGVLCGESVWNRVRRRRGGLVSLWWEFEHVKH